MGQSRVAWFRKILEDYPRIAIIGPPKSGKTTLARWASGRKTFHSDHFKKYKAGTAPPPVEDDRFDRANLDRSSDAWSAASQDMRDAVNAFDGPCVVEGVRVPHALRKGMRVDVVVLLVDPLQILSKGQLAMAKGVKTVLDDWASQNQDIPVLIAPPVPYEARRDHVGFHEEEE
jgi:hypothetical protein